MNRIAIVVLADPAAGTEEALGRIFNALAATWDLQGRGDDVTLLFQGAGTRWVEHLSDPAHPAHELFTAVADRVAGVSAGCAEVFGATEAAERSGLELLRDNAVPGTRGLPSLQRLIADGYTVLTF